MTRSVDLETEYETARRRLAAWAASRGFVTNERRLQYGVGVTFETPVGRRPVALYHSKKRPGSRLVIENPELEQAMDLVEALGGSTTISASHDTASTARPGTVSGAHIGADESGKGDYFGPLVACAVFVSEDAGPGLRSIGVRDSKELPDEEMRRMAPRIREICGHVGLVSIGPERYNQMHESMRRNANTVLARAHGQAISDVIGRLESAGSFVEEMTVVIDQFAKNEQVMLSEQRAGGWRVRLLQMPRAESDVAVAAASILARVKFVDGLSRLSRSAGVDLPKGAAAIVDRAGKALVRHRGPDALSKYAKRHFKNTNRVLQATLAN